MRRLSTSLSLALWLALGHSIACSNSPTQDTTVQVEFKWGVTVPLRDGTRLNATVYTPRQQGVPAPCLLILSLYVADTFHAQGMYFAAHGLPFAVVDVRGRGNSEGTFVPYVRAAQDGYDVVEWLAQQPYCNGKVSMWGGSYDGWSQWITAKERPPHLATIVPVASPYLGVDFPMRSNISSPYVMQLLTFTSGRTLQSRIFADDAFWSSFYRQWYESGRPFRDLDVMLGNPSATFQEWLQHLEPDSYWDALNPTPEEYSRLQIPILTITGSYDDDQPGALEHYRQYMQNASPEARARHYLVIGPWDHSGTRRPKLEVGGLRLGPASFVDLPRLHLEWYGWTMANQPKPEFLKNTVAYYVMGADHWRYADTLENVTAKSQPFFLDSSGSANDILSSGQLRRSPSPGGVDRYSYDPRDVSGPEIDAATHTTEETLTDQTVVSALHGKELVYHTAPFERDTEISGFFKLTAWISIDCPDTDFYASIYEILPDGSSITLSSDALRARYRQGPRKPTLIRSQAPLQYDFDHFTFISRAVKRGSRLRLVIAPIGTIVGATLPERNFNGGGVVANETRADARAVTVRLYHDHTHTSALYVPIGQPN